MEDLKKLKIKNWKETAMDRPGWEGKNPQRVVMPNEDDNERNSTVVLTSSWQVEDCKEESVAYVITQVCFFYTSNFYKTGRFS
jgi:hypothetical protein